MRSFLKETLLGQIYMNHKYYFDKRINVFQSNFNQNMLISYITSPFKQKKRNYHHSNIQEWRYGKFFTRG